MIETQNILLGQRYQLVEKLGSGSMGDVYRAVDKLNGDSVALKRLKVDGHGLLAEDTHSALMDTADFRMGLVHEFKTLASLRHPHIVSVLDYGFDDQLQPYFTMELLTTGTPLSAAAREQALPAKLELVIQLLQALAYLHRRNIIHCDLKPDNVLVIGKQVKVLDFGLALTKKNIDEVKDTVSGTLAYMAPEMLQGHPPSESSDLYAIGVLLYQILVGKHPFPTDSVTALITDIMHTSPDLDLIDVNPALKAIMQRLLAKQPHERFSNVTDVITALVQATDLQLSVETATTRESFLQAAQFVGRDAEMAQLSSALNNAMAHQGSVWLIAGESGVGKSRLLEELRILSLTRGVPVLRGQAISEGAAPYQIWQNILRRMVLNLEISDEEASILKRVIFNLESLLERPIPDMPMRDPQAAQEQLYSTIEQIFQRQANPLLLMMEDLQWSKEIDLLVRLSHQIASMPIIIVASYRDDEAPNLPDQIPQAHIIQLKRFDKEDVSAFTHALLGQSLEQNGFNEFLYQETEGNIFFIIEVVRSLAEEAGRLDKIIDMTLPRSVFTSGVQRIIQKRLDRIAPGFQRILKIAALIGRQLDLSILAEIAPELEQETWLVACSDAALLEANETNWRFAHDKIRETLLRDFDPDQAQTLHQQIAIAIEKLYGQSPEYLARLGYHWAEAQEFAKAAEYYEQAADLAMGSGLNRDAMGLFEQALDARARLSQAEDNQRRIISLVLKYARVGSFTRNSRIQVELERTNEIARNLQDEALLARTLAGTGTYFYVSGQVGQALGYFHQSLQLAEKFNLEELLILPYNIIGRALGVSGDTQKAHAMLTRGLALAEKYEDRELHAGSQSFYASNLLVMGRREDGLQAAELAIELAAKLGHSSRIAATYMTLGYGCSFSGLFEQAEQYLEKCIEIATETNDFHPLYVSLGCLGFIALQKGDTARAHYYFEKTLGMIGDALMLPNAPLYVGCGAELALLDGDIARAEAMADQAFAAAEKASQVMNKGQILVIQGKIAAASGDLERAVQLMQQGITLHEQLVEYPLQAMSLLQLARLYLQHDQQNNAAPLLDQAIQMFEQYQMQWHLETARRLQSTSGSHS